jgi:NADPH-dependent 2,4-dienoyl-CoA reductase/sulfur reductase-like enzyme
VGPVRVRAAAGQAAKRVAVVGAGPAGLTLAHALLTLPSGAEQVAVFEKYDDVKPEVRLMRCCCRACGYTKPDAIPGHLCSL